MQIIVKNYAHVNKSFSNWDTPNGRIVRSKDHYERLCEEQGMISYEESIERSKDNGKKPYILTEKAKAIIQAAKNSKDSRGTVKLSDKTIDAMRSIGAINKNIPSYMQLPTAYNKGGFQK